MVKGLSRRVVVIKSPDPMVFEEAIFIVKDIPPGKGITQDKIVKEAQNVANQYINSNVRKNIWSKLPPQAFALIGAAVTGAVWLISTLI